MAMAKWDLAQWSRCNACEVGGCCHQDGQMCWEQVAPPDGLCRQSMQDHPASCVQLCNQYMSHQLKQVSCMLLGACVVRSASVKLRLWPTHVLVLSDQEIQMLSKGLITLCLLHQVLCTSCNHVSGQPCEHVSWGHLVACKLALASSWPKLWWSRACMCASNCVCASVGSVQGQWGHPGWSTTHACKQSCSIKMVCTPCKFQSALLCTLYHVCIWQVKIDLLTQHLWRDVGVLRFELGCWEDGVRWSNYGEFAAVTGVQDQCRGVADLGKWPKSTDSGFKATPAPRKKLILSHFLCLILGEGSWSSHTHQSQKHSPNALMDLESTPLGGCRCMGL